MMNTRPGYWDVDRCAWVGAEPMHVAPPVSTSEHAHTRVIGLDVTAPSVEVPAPREPAEPVAAEV